MGRNEYPVREITSRRGRPPPRLPRTIAGRSTASTARGSGSPTASPRTPPFPRFPGAHSPTGTITLSLGDSEILVLDKYDQLTSEFSGRSWEPGCGRKGPRLPTGSGGRGSRDCPVPTAALLHFYTSPSVPFSSNARPPPTFQSPPRH